MLHKAPGSLQGLPSDYRFPPQLVPAFHADLRHRFPNYPVLQCFMWVPSLDRETLQEGWG